MEEVEQQKKYGKMSIQELLQNKKKLEQIQHTD